MIAGLVALPATAFAADEPPDVMLDGIVTIVHVDATDGPIGGATVTVSSYRDPAAPIQVLTATTDGDGSATLSGVARAADGAAPVLLEVRSDLASTVVTGAGCTETASWYATASTTAGPSVEIVLDSTSKSVVIDCPEPAPVEPTVAPQAPGGGVLAATGRPQLTPPATDTLGAPSRQDVTPSGVVGLLGALAGVAVVCRSAARSAVGRGRRRS